MYMKNSTKNARFQCFPASNGAILTSSPLRTMDKITEHSSNPSASLNRRLSQPLRGVSSERFSGMLPTLGAENALDFLQEPRSGFMEKHMSDHLSTTFGAGPKSAPAPSPGGKISPLQRAKQKLRGLTPKRS